MSYTTSNYPPPKPSKGGRTAAIIVAAVLGGLMLLCSGIVVAAVASSDDPKPGARPAVGRATPQPTPAPTTRGSVPDPGDRPVADLTVKDFVASVKVRGKDCVDFSTIPDVCNYQYEVRFEVANLEAYKSAGDAYSVTYAVKGLKGGEQLDTVEIDGEGNYSTFPGFGSAGPKAKLSVRVVEVEKRP